jgi:hypothetical protein
MNATLLALFLVASPLREAPGQEKKNPEEVKVTVDLDNVTLKDALEFLNFVSGVPIEPDDAATKKINPDLKVSIRVKDTTLVGALRLLLVPHGLEVKVQDKKKVVITVPEGR